MSSNFEAEYNPQVETFNIDSNPTRFGWYVMDSQVTGNKPFTYGILLQLKRLSYYIQIAYDIDSGKMARRYRTGNNSWSDWTYYITNTDIVAREYTKSGISVAVNAMTSVDFSDKVVVPDGYIIASVTPTLRGAGATGMTVAVNQDEYKYFTIFSNSDSTNIILKAKYLFIRQ